MQAEQYRIENENEILSPALIYYADKIRENTRRTIEIAGGAARLWPHVKSHKMRAMLEMQMEMGIRRFLSILAHFRKRFRERDGAMGAILRDHGIG